VWWLFGWGTCTFFWFIAHQFVPLKPEWIIALSSLLVGISLPTYIKADGWLSLTRALRQGIVPLLLLTPLFPALWVKASLPPYMTDEMAYQLISPYELSVADRWQFSPGIYHVIPKSLNIFFHASFALFRTYSPARIVHFAIVVSAFLGVYEWVKLRWGAGRAVLFWVLFFYWPGQQLLIAATSGYVDMAAAAFTFLGAVLAIEAVVFQNPSVLLASVAAFSLASGTKYSSLFSIASYGIIVLIAVVTRRISLSKSLIFSASLIAVLLGGFWYVKNIAYRGNPIYPFVFGCRETECVGNSSFFGDWTTRIQVKNIPSIVNDLMVGNRKLELALVCAGLLSLLGASRKVRVFNLVLGVGLAIEFGFMKAMSGFLMRYFWHIQFLLLLFMVVQTHKSVRDSEWVRILKSLLMAFLILFAAINFLRTSRFTYYPDRLSPQEISFATGKTDIFTWTKDRLPQMSQVISWCNNPPYAPVEMYRLDPDLIWFTYEGQMRIFMTNCHLTDLPIDPSLPANLTYSYIQTSVKQPFIYVSLAGCQPESQIQHYEYENPYQRYLRYANNDLVCHLPPVAPHIYSYTP